MNPQESLVRAQAGLEASLSCTPFQLAPSVLRALETRKVGSFRQLGSAAEAKAEGHLLWRKT